MIFKMTRRLIFVVTIIVVLFPYSLWAQRGVGRGGHGGAANTPKGEPADDDSLKDFSRAVALQADSQQVDLFQQLLKDTTAAVDKAGDLARHPEKTRQQSDILAYVLEVARGESHDFIEALSRAQKSGLKTWWKNVEKADTAVGKSWNALSKDLTRDSDEKRLAADNLNLKQALAKFQAEQGKLAQHMSITVRPAEGSDHPDGEAPVDLHARPFKVN